MSIVSPLIRRVTPGRFKEYPNDGDYAARRRLLVLRLDGNKSAEPLSGNVDRFHVIDSTGGSE
jgi:hypothetical protein